MTTGLSTAGIVASTGAIIATTGVRNAATERRDQIVRIDRIAQIARIGPTDRIAPTDRIGPIVRIGPIARTVQNGRNVPSVRIALLGADQMPLQSSLHGQGRGALPIVASTSRRGMSKTTPSCLRWAVVILIITPAVGRADDLWQVGSAPSFSTGKYGTETRTEVLHTPITARRLFDDGDVTFVFPLTCIRGNGEVTVVNGSPVRRERISNSGSSGASGRRGAATTGRTTDISPARRGTGDNNPLVTNCGMGDIVVRARYYLLDERAWVPTIAVRGHIKTPTANAELGLGTGRADEGVGIEVSRTLAGGVLAMVDGGYTVIGKPAGVDFSNNWWYDVGIGRNLANGAVNLSVFFEEYRAIVPGLANARDVLAAVSLKGASGWRVQVSGQLGLSDGAPDRGVTLGASRRF